MPPSHLQDLGEPNSIHMGLLLQLVQLPLDDILSLRFVNHNTQLGDICRLAEGALSPTVCVIDEDIKQYGPNCTTMMALFFSISVQFKAEQIKSV